MSAASAAWRRDGAVLLAGLVVLLGWDASGGDLRLAQLWGDATGFAWRDAWLTRTALHDGGRWLAWGLLLLQAWHAVRAGTTGPTRRERLFWLGIVVAGLVFVPLLKRFSATSCPWDLQPFGGAAVYVSHWRPGLVDGGPGHCFPSGHAVAAFAFFGVYFLWRPHRPSLANGLLALVWILGGAFGWAQLVRGAHFLSHTLWSAWCCWAICVAADRLSPLRLERAKGIEPSS